MNPRRRFGSLAPVGPVSDWPIQLIEFAADQQKGANLGVAVTKLWSNIAFQIVWQDDRNRRRFDLVVDASRAGLIFEWVTGGVGN